MTKSAHKTFCINLNQNRNLLQHLASFRMLTLPMPLKVYDVMVELAELCTSLSRQTTE